MLNLSLKKNASVIAVVNSAGRYLGTVTVTEIRNNSVQLAFDMPPDVEIAREALVCDCDDFDHKHPIWWCRPDLFPDR
jgi:sRNA-binding carbon storage regulator CsrA